MRAVRLRFVLEFGLCINRGVTVSFCCSCGDQFVLRAGLCTISWFLSAPSDKKVQKRFILNGTRRVYAMWYVMCDGM